MECGDVVDLEATAVSAGVLESQNDGVVLHGNVKESPVGVAASDLALEIHALRLEWAENEITRVERIAPEVIGRNRACGHVWPGFITMNAVDASPTCEW